MFFDRIKFEEGLWKRLMGEMIRLVS